MKKQRSLLGTLCTIEVKDSVVLAWDIEACFTDIENFEHKYSRFKKNNQLSLLNEKKSIVWDAELFTLISLWKKISKISKGNFDISILPLLIDAWYGHADTKLSKKVCYEDIELHPEDKKIILNNEISVELWAYGKWYMLDICAKKLSKKYKNFILDFGWDIKVSKKIPILLENPCIKNSFFWKVSIQNCAIASSNWQKRKLPKGHHLINAHTLASDNLIISVFTSHKLWVFADAYATCLSVCPKELSKKIMQQIPWLSAFVIYADGSQLRSWIFTNI